jgi:hypothetical protein
MITAAAPPAPHHLKEDPPLSVDASERRRRAEAAFGCTRQELSAALLGFAGLPPLAAESAGIVQAALELVERQEELPDWLELARVWMWFGRATPGTDPEVLAPAARSVLDGARALAAALGDEALRRAAFDMAPRPWLVEITQDALEAHAAPSGDPSGRAASGEALVRARRSGDVEAVAEHELQALAADPPHQWGPAARSILTCAVVGRVAALCAVYADVAGQPAAPGLVWRQEEPGCWRATEHLPGAAAPVTVEVRPRTPDALVGILPLSVSGPFAWTVTADLPGTGGVRFEAGQASGLAYAQWHAGQQIQALRSAPGGARREGRLLIPVPAGPAADTAAVPVWTVGLDEVLGAVAAYWGKELLAAAGTGGGPGWVSLPHHRGGGDQDSAAAAVLGIIEAPCPAAGEPANDDPVDGPLFEDFLRSHAVVITPTARAYLAGLADAGPGPVAFSRRHTAAMRALLALLDTSPAAAALATGEIGPPPAAGGYRALLDPACLLDHLRFYAPNEDRPQGLDPAQLAVVRQDICQGLAALAVAQMRRHLGSRPGEHTEIDQAVRAAIRDMNTFPDPGDDPATIEPGDHLLPDPPFAFTVSFRTDDEPDFGLNSADSSRPVRLCLPVPQTWGPEVAAPGYAVLAGRPVLDVLHRDETGRPLVARVVDLDVNAVPSQTSGDGRPVWYIAAHSPLVNVDWSGMRPALYIPEPEPGR